MGVGSEGGPGSPAASVAAGAVVELVPGEHYLVLFVEPGDLPGEETIEELRILAYARRRRDTLGPGNETAVPALAEAASADVSAGSVWARCQAAVSYVRNYRAHVIPREVNLGNLAETALAAIGSVVVADPITTAFSKIDINSPAGGYHVTVQSHGAPVQVIIDDARRLVDVIIGTPEAAVSPAKRPGTRLPGETRKTSRVFVSYIREDSGPVEDLCDHLNESGILTWRDTADLWPGEDWRAKIRQEITANALIFLACFSRQSTRKDRSYQRQELDLAIEQLQLRRPTDQPWLIPVRFDDCEIPDLDIGGARTLGHLQRLDLFGDEYASNADRLVTMIRQILEGPGRGGDADDRWVSPPAGRLPPVPSLLRAWHLPPDWRQGDARPAPGDAYPARLDVLWSLDRGPLRGVLADSPGIDLADALGLVEFHVLRDWTSTPRLWRTIHDTEAAEQPPATPASLSQLVTPSSGVHGELAVRPAGSGLGLVVRCDDGGPRFADPALAASYAAGLARAWPEAAVVFHVTAEFPARAMGVAAEIGQWLSRHDPSMRTTVVTRVLPGTDDPPPVDPPITKQTILDRIPTGGKPAARSSADGDFVTAIDDLAEQGTPLPRLAAAFRNLRDLDDQSGEYLAALRAHASRGADPARYASLAAAAARDGDLDAWLSAAARARRPAVPELLPAGLMSQEALDSVVLALLRRAEIHADIPAARKTAGRWRLLISPRVQQAADHLGFPGRARLIPAARAAADREFLLSCPEPYSAQAALRAGIGQALTLHDLCPDDRPSPAAWALLTHRPLDQEIILLIASWPADLRRVLGFITDGEERAERSAETLERLTSAYWLLRPEFTTESQLDLSSLEA